MKASSETMARPLFRLEAVQSRQGRMWSGAPMRPPVSLAIFTAALLAAVVAIALFLGTQSYARKATATGYLAPLHGVVRVVPPRAGMIISVAVSDGDAVRAGDPLLKVADERLSVAGTDIDANVRRALTQQRDLELSQISLEEATTESEQKRLRERIDRLDEECQALGDQLSMQQGRVELADEQARLSRDLAAKGYVAGVEQRRREDARLGQVQGLDTLHQQLAAKEGEIVELHFTLAQLPARSATRIAVLRAAAAEIDSRLAQAEGQRAYLITAPTSGRVSALQANVGNQADPTRPLLSIVPEGDELEAVLFVPERAIGFVAPGQDVRLSLDAFPFQRYGAQFGTITTVDRTVLRPDQLNVGVQPPTEPAYRATVALRAQSLTAYGRAIPLQADMQLRADIIFDRRSFLQWLFDPVLSARARS
ncbi:MAG: HlyD family efflux transporter periplasmic adaptor subunit [Acetobacteraceae bacterium]